MKIQRRWVAVAATVAATTLVLSGCGRASESGSAAADTSTISDGAATGEVTIWAQGTEGEALQEFLAPFEAENPDVTIKVTAVPWDSAQNKYQTAVAGGTTPDIGMLGSDWMPTFSNALAPTPDAIDTSGMFPFAVGTTEFGGTAYGVPWYVETRLLFHRVDLMNAAGFDEFPTDWQGLHDLAAGYQQGGAEYGIALPSGGWNSFLGTLPFAWSNGAEVMNADETEWTLDTPEIAEAVDYIDSFFVDGLANPNPDSESGSIASRFVDGSVPMFLSGPWTSPGSSRPAEKSSRTSSRWRRFPQLRAERRHRSRRGRTWSLREGEEPGCRVEGDPVPRSPRCRWIGSRRSMLFRLSRRRGMTPPCPRIPRLRCSAPSWQVSRRPPTSRRGRRSLPRVTLSSNRSSAETRIRQWRSRNCRPQRIRSAQATTILTRTEATGAHTRSRGLSPRARRRRTTVVAYAFALPFLLSFAVFMVFPLLSSFAMSFTDFRNSDIESPFAVTFVGLDQYVAIFQNPQFVRSLFNTIYFVVVGIPLTMAVALALAVALNSGINRFRTAFRVGFYAPVVTSIVAVAVVWRFILQPDGLLNTMLATVGIAGPDWLNDPLWSMPAMILMAVWRNMGTLMVIFLAGLQTIPQDVLEAAQVDGANAWKRFTRITLPLLRPTRSWAACSSRSAFCSSSRSPSS